MRRDEAVIEEINSLWAPVYPFLADHVLSASGVTRGRALDLGPFAGGIALALLAAAPGLTATVVDEAEAGLTWARTRALRQGAEGRLTAIRGRPDPIPALSASWDLVIIRGAFFFLTASLLREARRVLRPGGFAWVGGGFGPSTPESVIEPIAERSRLLNAAVGKRRVSEEETRRLVRAADLGNAVRISAEGGLWIEVRG